MSHDPRLTPARPDLAARHLEGKVPATRFVDGRDMVVGASVLDLLASPEAEALASQLLMGEGFRVYEEDPATGLAWGQAPRDGYVGYVALAGLEAAVVANAQIAVLSTHVYPEPRPKTRPLAQLPYLAQVTTAGQTGDFVELASGGFCPAQHLAPLTPQAKDFVAVAESFLGIPYLWGGRSTFGMDCSGLIQLAYQAVGVSVPRDSDMQASIGTALDGVNALKRGDLIFWKGHVGVMLDADILLHASGHQMRVSAEPLAEAEARIRANGGGPITGRQRL